MKGKEFDQNIKRKLQELDNKASSDWDDFSKILSEVDDFKDLDFDKSVSKKLKEGEASFNSMHWVLLKNRLESEARIRKEVVYRKIQEASVVLLLFMSFLHINQYFAPKTFFDDELRHTPIVSVLEYPEISQAIKKNATIAKLRQSTLISIASLLDERNNNLHDISKVVSEPSSHSRLSIAFTPISIIKLNELSHFNNESQCQKSSDHEIYNLDPHDDLAHSTELNKTRATPQLALHSLCKVSYELPNVYPSFYMPSIESKKSTYYIHAKAFADMHYIGSKADEKFQLPNNSLKDINFGGGFGISALNNNFEVAIGLQLQQIRYNPLPVEHISGNEQRGFISQSIQEISFTNVTMPIDVNYHFNPTNKFHWYIGAGVSLNASLFTAYDIKTDVIVTPNPPNSFNGGSGPRNYPSSDFSNKNFYKGIAQQGSVHDNFVMSAQINTGVEYQLSEKTYATAALSLNKMLSSFGIGPNNDIIDAVRIGIGLKYQI